MAQKPELDLERLILTHQSGVWRYLRVLGASEAEADDLTQETFLALLKRPFELRSDAATVSYLRTVARNFFISAIRKLKRRPHHHSLDFIDEAWTLYAGEDSSGERLQEILNGCLENLAPRAKAALELRYRDGLTGTEIAGVFEVSESNAKSLMHRARELLRDCVDRRLEL